MATKWVLSECGFRPLPKIYPQSRTTPPSKSFNLFRLRSSPEPKSSGLFPSFRVSNLPKHRNWALNVVAPLKANGEKSENFDPGAPPQFTLVDIRAAIPKHCWVRDTWRSMSYVLRDVVIIFGLAVVASYFNNWLVWPLYWFCQGTMFWALFVIGHDCGHGSFSNDRNLNTVIGHFVNCTILVPYHGWRISHRTHHQHQGHAEYDESWHPPSETTLKNLDDFTKTMRFILPFQLLAFPFYLFSRSPGKKGSHFDPDSDLFLPNERNDIITSTACCIAMAALLVYLCFVMGPFRMLKLYGVPYWVFVMWLDLVTYLNHHGYEEKVPWYRGKEWSYFRGGLTTIDRDYGLINNIHHDIGTHVVHHLFPQIPHYHLVEATEAAKPVLGKYYREPEKSGPLPLHLIGTLVRSLNEDHYVSDTGEVLYYQKDPNMYKKTE